jgi:hypothetical protein
LLIAETHGLRERCGTDNPPPGTGKVRSKPRPNDTRNFEALPRSRRGDFDSAEVDPNAPGCILHKEVWSNRIVVSHDGAYGDRNQGTGGIPLDHSYLVNCGQCLPVKWADRLTHASADTSGNKCKCQQCGQGARRNALPEGPSPKH